MNLNKKHINIILFLSSKQTKVRDPIKKVNL